MTPRIQAEALAEMKRHAGDEYPRECCGVVVGRRGSRQSVLRMRNIQDQLHASAPAVYTRTARTAYAIGFEDQQRIEALHDDPGAPLVAIYHSHPDHRAYFSAEDRAQATPFGEPSYPEALQVVLSVIGGEVRDVRAFRWSPLYERYVAYHIPGLS
jgi:proteasome lid subunit RPN8/RPN11